MDKFKTLASVRIEQLERDKVALMAEIQDARRVANDLCAEVERLKRENDYIISIVKEIQQGLKSVHIKL